MENTHFKWNRLPHVLVLLLLMLPAAANAEKALTPYSAEYKVKISVLSGRLTTDLRANGDGFQATHVIKPTGLARMFKGGVISETSRLRSDRRRRKGELVQVGGHAYQ